jgi:hypothetical protein
VRAVRHAQRISDRALEMRGDQLFLDVVGRTCIERSFVEASLP